MRKIPAILGEGSKRGRYEHIKKQINAGSDECEGENKT